MPPTSLPRRDLLRALCLPALFAAPFGRASAAPLRQTLFDPPARPNVVLILLDDMDDRSVATMPAVQELLIRQGVSFDQFIANIPSCSPSRASLLLGRYAHNHGVVRNDGDNGGYVGFSAGDAERSTVATWVQDAGYRTALIGKYLNNFPTGKPPEHIPPGWTEWYGAFDDDGAESPRSYFGATVNENGSLVRYDNDDYTTDIQREQAIGFINRAEGGDDPFFLLVATRAPHGPARPAPRHEHLFADAGAPRVPSFDEADVSDKPAWVRESPRLDATAVAAIDERYRERVQTLQAVDELVAAIVEALERTGALANTFIFFTSDNGYHLGEHRLGREKASPYEESIRMPLVVRGPGITPGSTVRDLATIADLAPTIAGLAGARPPASVDGRSLVPLLLGSGWETARSGVLVEYFMANEDAAAQDEVAVGANGTRQPSFAALRGDGFVYAEYGNGERELYDLAADPYQLENLAATTPAERIVELSARLDALVRCAGESCRAAEELSFADPAEVPPLPRVTSPAPMDSVPVGDVLDLRGEALDGRGAPVAAEGLAWTVVLRDNRGTRSVVGKATGSHVQILLPRPARQSQLNDWRVEIHLTALTGAGPRRTTTLELPVHRARG